MAAFPNKNHASRASGFTLLEMLVVILIIVVLMGIVFRLARVSTGAGASSDTTARLEALKAALEEFYAEYGMYPPVAVDNGVQGLTFSYPARLPADISGSAGSYFSWGLLSFLKNRAEVIYKGGSQEVRENTALYKSGSPWANGYNKVLSNGLRTMDDVKQCTTERDRIFLNRIEPFLSKAKVFSDTSRKGKEGADRNIWITSYYAHDGWDRDYIYISRPPYQSYSLLSRGADGRPTDEELKKGYDPLDPDLEIDGVRVNKDNIYGNIGDSK